MGARKGEHRSKRTEFQKGQVPWNKGLRYKGTPRPSLRRPKIIKLCARCGREFEANRKSRIYCSRRCAVRRKNGITMQSAGYIMVAQDDGRRELQHRIIAEQMLGRKLTKQEIVHHINGIKADNRPENLMVMTTNQHRALERYFGSLWITENPDRVERVSREFITAADAG